MVSNAYPGRRDENQLLDLVPMTRQVGFETFGKSATLSRNNFSYFANTFPEFFKADEYGENKYTAYSIQQILPWRDLELRQDNTIRS